jgi:hypothetical protein
MKGFILGLAFFSAMALTGRHAWSEDSGDKNTTQAGEQQPPELDAGETLEKLGFPAVTMRLTGWTKFGKGKVYTLPLKKGQHVRISFSSKSRYTFMAIFDLSSSDDESFFGTDEDGPVADVTLHADTTWLIKPYYSRVTRRRGLGAPYEILIDPNPAGATPAQSQTPDQTAPGDAPSDRPSLFPPRPPANAGQTPSLFPPKPPAQP